MAIEGSNFSNIEKHHLELKYSQKLQLLAQQQNSKLESCVTVENGLKGNNVCAANQIGTFSTRERTGRFEETHIVDIDRTQRWYAPKMFDGAALFDNWDRIRMEITPEDKVLDSMRAAYKRDIDTVILDNYFAANKTGKSAAETTAYDTDMTIGVSSGSGDILKKLILARTKFVNRNIDIESEEIFCLVPAEMENELMAAGIYLSSDYMNDKAVTGKKLPAYGGINFVRTTLLKPSDGKILCPIFCKSGVGLGKWLDIQVKVSERADLSYANQIHIAYALGATRLEEAKCGAIEVAVAA